MRRVTVRKTIDSTVNQVVKAYNETGHGWHSYKDIANAFYQVQVNFIKHQENNTMIRLSMPERKVSVSYIFDVKDILALALNPAFTIKIQVQSLIDDMLVKIKTEEEAMDVHMS